MSEANIVVKLKDQFTQATNSMKTANKGFTTSLEETQQKARAYSARLDELVRKQSKLQTSLEAARLELKSAKSAFGEAATAANSDKLTAANEKYNKLKNQLSDMSRAAREAQRDLNSLSETNRKVESRSGISGSSGGVVQTLGKLGITAALGQLASKGVGLLGTSLFGSSGGSYISSALSGAAGGAALGSTVAPGLGTAIGAIAGLGSGLASAYLDQLGEKDDAYKQTVSSIYQDVLSRQETALTSGTTTAAGRESTRMSFATLLGGNEAADTLLGDIHNFANLTPYTYNQLTPAARTALAYGFDSGDVMQLIEQAGNASAALGAGSSGLSTIMEVLGRMNMGIMDREQLNRLTMLGMNPYQMLADASNEMAENGASMIASGNYTPAEIANIQSMMDKVATSGAYTAEEIKDMVTKGLIPGAQAAEALADQMGRAYDGALKLQSTTAEGLESTLEGLQEDLDAAMGEGYYSARKQGLEDQISFLQGDTGADMQEAYRLIGEYQAELLNKQEELERDAMQSVMSGTLQGDWAAASQAMQAKMTALMGEYDAAKLNENGAEMGRIIAAAQALAQEEYTNTDGYQQQIDAQKKLAEDVQQGASESYYTAGYELGKAMSKGVAAGALSMQELVADAMEAVGSTATDEIQWTDDRTNGTSIMSTAGQFDFATLAEDRANSHAYGLEYVPYNGYPAMLHQGEQVLTAEQARQSRGGVNIAKLADSIIVREEADIDRIAQTLADKIVAASLVYGG